MRKLSVMVAGIALAALAAESRAIVVSGGSGNPAPLNNTAPADDPGWNRVGSFETSGGNGSGVYLGNGWVLTANHVNGKSTFTLNGNTYTLIGGTGQRLANPAELGLAHASDLWLGQYTGVTPFPAGVVTIASSTPDLEAVGTMIGTGRTQTSQTPTTYFADTSNPNDWEWDDAFFPGANFSVQGFVRTGDRDKRWAQSPVASGQETLFFDFSGTGLDADQPGYYTEFRNELNGGMGAASDSGSPLFIKNGSTWELAGIAHTLGFYSGQFDDPDTLDTSLYGNATFYGDLSVYANQINTITGIPEPGSIAVALGLGWIVLGRKRR